MNPNRTNSIFLIDKDIPFVGNIARKRFDWWNSKKRKDGGKHKNTWEKHLTGAAGEAAGDKMLTIYGAACDPVYTYDFSGCDLVANLLRIEIKTWNRKYWPEKGRAILTTQIDAIIRKSDVVAWFVVPSIYYRRGVLDLSSSKIECMLMGWNYPEEIKKCKPRPYGENGALCHVVDRIHSWNSLYDLVK